MVKTRRHKKRHGLTRKKRTQKGGCKLEKIVHQIWFGSEIPEWRQVFFDSVKDAAASAGFEYRLWTNADRNLKNFPRTLKIQNAALEKGKEQGQNRWAQVADLARIEIVHNNGGVYLDSLFLVRPQLFKTIEEKFSTNPTLQGIFANEDPCGLECENKEGEKYLANSFFAGVKFCRFLGNLLTKKSLSSIDLENQQVNKTTGPYYLRKGIDSEAEVDEDGETYYPGIFMLKTEQIYPLPMSGSVRRPPKQNMCLSKTPKEGWIKVRDDMYVDIQCIERYITEPGNENTLAYYQVGLGGTWSY